MKYQRSLRPDLANVVVNQSFYARYIKRILDICVALIAIIVTMPINIVIAIITYFDVGRPIFFRQIRIGKDLKPFTITKFRNMREIYGSDGKPLPAEKRVTRFGKFVRKTSLDELLNFWSILKGDMSLIGPRPLLEDYIPYYTERQLMRHAVRPGLECPPLKTRNHTRSWEEQFEDDIWYVENISFLTDCRLLFALIKLVFNKKEIHRRSDAIRGRFDEECIALEECAITREKTII